MSQQITDTQTRASAFDTIARADQAIRQLRVAGFADDQLAIVCPEKFKSHFLPEATHSETPSITAPEALATGGMLGATLGGLALGAAVLTGVGGLATAGVLIGGGAIAGGFSNLIVAKGYEVEADDEYKRAVQHGQIVIGVEVPNEDGVEQLAKAERILKESGGQPFGE